MHLDIGDVSISGSIVMAVICALIAHSKGRSVLIWGLLGFVFSCFALVFCLLADDLSEAARSREAQRQAQRRWKERQKGDRHRLGDLERRFMGRLDAHDLVLGLDTRDISAPMARPASLEPPERPSWFYEEAGATAGPVSRRALQSLLAAGAVDRDTLVWTEGMSDWAPLDEIFPRTT